MSHFSPACNFTWLLIKIFLFLILIHQKTKKQKRKLEPHVEAVAQT